MSSTSQTDERAPLLGPGWHSPAAWLATRYSGAALIVPVALICRIATLLPSTTTFYILQQFICRLHYRTHGPDRIPPDGRMPDALCVRPDIERNYAAFIALVALMDGIGSMVGYAAISFVAARAGRRPAMAAVLAVGLIADAAIIISSLGSNTLIELPLFALWLIASSFSQTTLISFVANIYLVDLVDEEKRTSALSSLSGWSALGSTLSFTLGGTITTRGGNLLAVYYIAGAIWAAALLYVWLVLPESFPKGKREDLRLQREQDSSRNARSSVLRLPAFLAPLKHLKPARDPRTGRRNWRLVICAVHIFFAGLGGGFAVASLLTIITSLYHYTPAETGYTLTALSGTNMFVLTFVIPALVRVLRPWYTRTRNPNGASADEDAETETSDDLDVHIAAVSWAIEAAGYLIFGHTTTRATQLAAVILVGCGPGYFPAVRSLVAASVEPLKQGETLGMIEMVWGLGVFLSPLLMGSILSATISTVPQTIFYVQASIVLSAAGILLFVRDSDRYHHDKPHSGPALER
ncbi:MFS general substrate transporter [Mycena sp. CBHHK59/15]|nr:MFS general substrate transporter [Mycena sp. CBHHK59/15]